MAPRKPKHPWQTDHQQRQHRERGTGEAQPARGQRSQKIAQYTPCVPRQQTVQSVEPAPFQHRTGQHEQQQTHPEADRMRPDALPTAGAIQWLWADLQRALLAANPDRQPREPGLQPHQKKPPSRKAQQIVAAVGQQSPQSACPVGDFGSGARGAPSGVGWRMAEQSKQPKRQRHRPQHHPNFLGEPPHPGGWLAGAISIERVEQIGHGCREKATPTLTQGPTSAVRRRGPKTALSSPVHKRHHALWWGFNRTPSTERVEPLFDEGAAVLGDLDEATVFQVFHHPADHFS